MTNFFGNIVYTHLVPWEKLDIFQLTIITIPLFDLNVTFLHFKLPDRCHFRKSLRNCAHYVSESLSVHQDVHNKTTGFSALHYCMRRAPWSVFSGSVVTLTHTYLRRWINKTTLVNFQFQVTDQGILTTNSSVGFEIQKPWFIAENHLSFPSNFSIYVFVIVSKRYNKLQIKPNMSGIAQLFLTVGKQNSKKCEPNKSFLIKYFYCSLHVTLNMFTHQTLKAKLNQLVEFNIFKKKIDAVHMDQDASFRLQVCDTAQICQKVYRLVPTEGLFSNIRVSTLFKEMFVHFSCFYGGVALYDGEKHTEMYTQCDTHHDFDVFGENEPTRLSRAVSVT